MNAVNEPGTGLLMMAGTTRPGLAARVFQKITFIHPDKDGF